MVVAVVGGSVVVELVDVVTVVGAALTGGIVVVVLVHAARAMERIRNFFTVRDCTMMMTLVWYLVRFLLSDSRVTVLSYTCERAPRVCPESPTNSEVRFESGAVPQL